MTRLMGGLLAAILLAGCAETAVPGKVAVEADSEAVKQTTSDRISALPRSEAIDIAAIPGDSSAERLLHLMGVPDATKGAMMVSIDSNIEVLRASGATAQADQLEANRALLLQAADENMDAYLDIASDVYEKYYTQDELDRLVVLFSDPLMQKHATAQLDLLGEMTTAAEAWAETVGERYAELVEEQGQ